VSSPTCIEREARTPTLNERTLTRFDILQTIAPFLEDKLVICNIGIPSRELYQIKHQPSNFYMLGSLGLASSIGLGVSLFTKRPVVVIDGDGSLLANLGSMATIAQAAPRNLSILAIDNGAHGSTGNQLTATSACVDLSLTMRGLGINNVFRGSKREEIESILPKLGDGPNFIHIIARAGNAQVPTIPLTPNEIKRDFMREISNT
jgi:sulfopyruvate decarboxylase subunit beta